MLLSAIFQFSNHLVKASVVVRRRTATSPYSGKEHKKAVSSADVVAIAPSGGSGASTIYRVYRNGPSTLSWGTPAEME